MHIYIYPSYEGVYGYIARYLCYTLQQMNMECSIVTSPLEGSIVIGAHGQFKIPKNAILLNTEYLHDDLFWWKTGYADLLRHHPVWDISGHNIKFLFEKLNVKGTLINIVFPIAVPIQASLDIDVLFVGSMNSRRRHIIDSIRRKGLVVKTCASFPDDIVMSRTKLALIIPSYEGQQFDVKLVWQFLSYRKRIISEWCCNTREYDRYHDMITSVPYSELISTILYQLRTEIVTSELHQTPIIRQLSYNKQVVIFRTHRDSNEDRALVTEYRDELLGYCDVAVTLCVKNRDEKDNIMNWTRHCSNLNIQLSICYENEDKPSFYQKPWIHGQYCFTEAYVDLLYHGYVYEYYWIIEYDARYTGSLQTLLDDHLNISTDVLGTATYHYADIKDWGWWFEEKVNLPLPLEERACNYAPVMRLSRRLLTEMMKAVAEYYSNVESFIPTISIHFFGHHSIGNIKSSHWTRWTCRYSPHHGSHEYYKEHILPNLEMKNMIFHPIK